MPRHGKLSLLEGNGSNSSQCSNRQDLTQPTRWSETESNGVVASLGMLNHRDFLKSSFAGLVAATLLSRPPQRAEAGFFGDEVADALDGIAKERTKVQEIVVALKKKDLKGTPDDSAVIVRYIAAVFTPLQRKWISSESVSLSGLCGPSLMFLLVLCSIQRQWRALPPS